MSATDLFGEGDARLVYVFVNQASPVAVMNLQITGTFMSPVYAAMEVDSEFAAAYEEGRTDFLPFVPNDKASTGFLSPFTASTINGYRVEWDAKVTRKQWFSELHPALRRSSRSSGGRTASASAAGMAGRWRKSDGSASHTYFGCAASNMEIISLARTAYARAMLDADSVEQLWRSYWTGTPDYSMELPTVDGRGREIVSVDPIWELLIDGRLDLDRSWRP